MKFLVIQTAFIGDVVLATPIIEKLQRFYPHASIDILVRKGNEALLNGHPKIRKVLVWNKKQGKYRQLWQILQQIRAEQYDWVVNCQRFAASGLLTACSGAARTAGFSKNPFALFFNKKIKHRIGNAAANSPFGLPYTHEVERNLALIEHLTDASPERPRLYPDTTHLAYAAELSAGKPYVCIAPSSVWATKQWPAYKWIDLISLLPASLQVYLLGAPADEAACEAIRLQCDSARVFNMAGKMDFLRSIALMKAATMNFVNDSAPLHFASAVNAPVTAVFCSTIPEFGFTPLSDQSHVIQTPDAALPCRPCGLHGHAACPRGHFLCATQIEAAFVVKQILPFS